MMINEWQKWLDDMGKSTVPNQRQLMRIEECFTSGGPCHLSDKNMTVESQGDGFIIYTFIYVGRNSLLN